MAATATIKNVFRDQVHANKQTHLVPCRSPLILISQIQRSGGTLLSQLFDDHPEVFAYPDELTWGKPRKWDWPTIDIARWVSVRGLWRALNDDRLDRFNTSGYQKGAFSNLLPFVFDRSLQWSIFRECLAPKVTSRRQVLDAFMTAFFNAWLDYQNLYRSPKLYTTAFTPRVNMYPQHVEQFFRDYPDGHIISVLRDPFSWLASAKKHRRPTPDMKQASTMNLMSLWEQSTLCAKRNKSKYGDRYHVVLFSDLVSDPRGLLSALCNVFRLSWSENLLNPTFNGMPISPNTSHELLRESVGIVEAAQDTYAHVLTEEEIVLLRTSYEPVYAECAASAIQCSTKAAERRSLRQEHRAA
jgi:hypothetical protein